jgi:hypothetical protein
MEKEFQYRTESSNLGPGHGHHGGSDLLSSFVKYGKPLEEYYHMLSPVDQRVVRNVLKNDEGLTGAMGYTLFYL